jgi:hypothetical protein
MIQSATRLARILGDIPRATKLRNLEVEVEGRIRDMELNKNFLENRLDEQLRAISERRAELDRQEQEAIAIMLKEDHENRLLIGSLLEESCREAFEREEVARVETAIDHPPTESDENNEDQKIVEVEPTGFEGNDDGIDVTGSEHNKTCQVEVKQESML